ncbi:MAG: 16S rRNA (adenine(1518)-N(6)/adenine(1519)-N(6))-dimethyltransferase RsmA [Bacteroidia bacterium]|nr:16S rRNA (adenine(1518)-N(6)/adenine(1519)-N(6))-dimethyltransferase RsmA [Bacteroidia bacterium]
MKLVKPKKHLGQHFLKDQDVALAIVDALALTDKYKNVLEIGPGMGVLTQYLLQNNNYQTHVIDIDTESVQYLREAYVDTGLKIIEGDFLKADFTQLLSLQEGEQFAVIGNFPYNISTQIIFKILENRPFVPEVVGMFQKEVAERYAAKHGSKVYGITSVLTQAYYNIEYLMTVDATLFDPPPKVQSAVIRLTRKEHLEVECNETMFYKVVKTAFNQRRKTLRNALKALGINYNNIDEVTLGKRAEQLSVAQFIDLTNTLEGNK